MANLQHGTCLTEQILAIEENAKEMASQQRAGAYFNELEGRHRRVLNPGNAPLTTKLSALGFFWYLGVSPAAALINHAARHSDHLLGLPHGRGRQPGHHPDRGGRR